MDRLIIIPVTGKPQATETAESDWCEEHNQISYPRCEQCFAEADQYPEYPEFCPQCGADLLVNGSCGAGCVTR